MCMRCTSSTPRQLDKCTHAPTLAPSMMALAARACVATGGDGVGGVLRDHAEDSVTADHLIFYWAQTSSVPTPYIGVGRRAPTFSGKNWGVKGVKTTSKQT